MIESLTVLGPTAIQKIWQPPSFAFSSSGGSSVSLMNGEMINLCVTCWHGRRAEETCKAAGCLA